MYKARNLLLMYYFWYTTSRKVVFFICSTMSYMSQETVKSLLDSSWFMASISPRIAPFSSCVVCKRFLFMHSLKYPHMNKSVTVRLGERTGHGMHDTWKRFSPLIKSYILNWFIITEQVLKWHDIIISFSVCRLCPLRPSYDKIAFWNWSVLSTPLCLNVGSTQPLTEMSTRDISWGVKAAVA